MPRRLQLLQSTALSTFGFVWAVTPSAAADLTVPTEPYSSPLLYQAVSTPNFKIEPFGGWANRDDGGGEYIYGAAAAFSMPVGQHFGLQVDGLLGSWGSDFFYGAAGHFFWRDPSVGLAGIYAAYTHFNAQGGLNAAHLAFEGEYYMQTSTVRGLIGWEGVDIPSNLYANVNFDWYATQDLALTIGYRYTGGESGINLGAEWLSQHNVFGSRLSVFADGKIGLSNHHSILAGVRLYTGPAQTLIAKHRQDDPAVQKHIYAFGPLLVPPEVPEEPVCPPGEIFDPELGFCVFP